MDQNAKFVKGDTYSAALVAWKIMGLLFDDDLRRLPEEETDENVEQSNLNTAKFDVF